MKTNLILLVAMLLFWSCNKKEATQIIIDDFFVLYTEKGANDALNFLFETNEWFSNSEADISNVQLALNEHIKKIGNYCGYEIVLERTIGSCLRQYSCLVKHEQEPLRFSFLFYKSNETWKLNNFKFDNDLSEEIEEASKFYYIE